MILPGRLWMLLPSVYNMIRMKIISFNQVDINILGQMEWFDLIDEILVTMLTVPLFSLLKPKVSSKEKNGLALILSFCIYAIVALIISVYVSQISEHLNEIAECNRVRTAKVTAYDEAGKIGEGTHKRALVNIQKFLDKTYTKL